MEKKKVPDGNSFSFVSKRSAHPNRIYTKVDKEEVMIEGPGSVQACGV